MIFGHFIKIGRVVKPVRLFSAEGIPLPALDAGAGCRVVARRAHQHATRREGVLLRTFRGATDDSGVIESKQPAWAQVGDQVLKKQRQVCRVNQIGQMGVAHDHIHGLQKEQRSPVLKAEAPKTDRMRLIWESAPPLLYGQQLHTDASVQSVHVESSLSPGDQEPARPAGRIQQMGPRLKPSLERRNQALTLE